MLHVLISYNISYNNVVIWFCIDIYLNNEMAINTDAISLLCGHPYKHLRLVLLIVLSTRYICNVIHVVHVKFIYMGDSSSIFKKSAINIKRYDHANYNVWIYICCCRVTIWKFRLCLSMQYNKWYMSYSSSFSKSVRNVVGR